MQPVQIIFLVLTFLAPVTLWAWGKNRAGFDRTVCRTLAALLLLAEAGTLAGKLFLEHRAFGEALPMHLCDWALFAAAGALWFRWELAFEVTYFWGLAGTLQALLTPDLDVRTALGPRVVFFFIHSGIVVAVLYLMLALRRRPVPASLGRAVAASLIYVAAASGVNALAGTNYGFLAHKPAQASLLSLFSDAHGWYVLEIILTGCGFFAALYLPWLVRDLARGRPLPR